MKVDIRVTRYTISALPPDHRDYDEYSILVEERAKDLWGVFDGSYSLGTDGVWEYEPRPSARTKEWLATHRFDGTTAVLLATAAAREMSVNGKSVAAVLREDGESR